MSGHSKWATIKRKKASIDSKRSKVFSKIIKEITVAVREGGSEPDNNPRLRLAIDNAKGQNLPKDNIERAISKGKDKSGAGFTDVCYEGYTPGGVAVFVECTTDNLNRTVSNIRSYFNKLNGNLGTKGCVEYLFSRKAVFNIHKAKLNEDEFTLDMIDAGAEDIEWDGELFIVTSSLEDFGNIQQKLEQLSLTPEAVNLQRIPLTTTKLNPETAQKAMKLIETIEDDEDVKAVYHNLELTDEVLAVLQ